MTKSEQKLWDRVFRDQLRLIDVRYLDSISSNSDADDDRWHVASAVQDSAILAARFADVAIQNRRLRQSPRGRVAVLTGRGMNGKVS